MVRDADATAKKVAEAKLAAMMEAKFLDMFGGDDDGDAAGASVKKKNEKYRRAYARCVRRLTLCGRS